MEYLFKGVKMNFQDANYYAERLEGLVKDLTFDLKHEKDEWSKCVLTNAIRHLTDSNEVFKRLEPKEE